MNMLAPTGKTHPFSTFFPLFKLHVSTQIFHHSKCALIKRGNGNNSDLNLYRTKDCGGTQPIKSRGLSYFLNINLT